MGFHQVEVNPRDRAKTAFFTHRGVYVYSVMPVGLCNAPATFQRLMEKILGPFDRFWRPRLRRRRARLRRDARAADRDPLRCSQAAREGRAQV